MVRNTRKERSMRLLSLAAAAATVAGGNVGTMAEEASPPRKSSLSGFTTAASGNKDRNRSLEGLTTKDLEKATRKFIKENSIRIRVSKEVDGKDGEVYHPSGKKKRLLRSFSTRQFRASKGGKDLEQGGGDWGHEKWSGSAKSGKGGGKWWSGSGKSGKEWGSWSGDWGHEELFYLLPSACPNECISSLVSSENEMIDSIKECRHQDESQMWMVRSDGSYIQIESYDKPGMCIAVDYEMGDDMQMLAETCDNGELFLKDCEMTEYGTEWYFTGGQLVSSTCWGAGLSSFMTVFLQDGDSNDMRQCDTYVSVYGLNGEALLKADTFMFVDRLPEAPFYMNPDDVNDMLNNRRNKVANKISGNNKSGITMNAAEVDVPLDLRGNT